MTPPTVAIGTLRCGSRTTPAETDALSTPMKAQSVKLSVAMIAAQLSLPDTFQPSEKVAGENQNQPKIAMPRIGTSAKEVVKDCSLPTTFGPRMLA